MAKTLSGIIVNHLSQADYSSIPAEQIRRAKTRLLDSLGLIAAGVRATGSKQAVDMISAIGGRSESPVLTTAFRVPAMHAAFINALLMRSYDFEPVGAARDDGTQIPSHITGTTVAVGLAVGERQNCRGTDLLAAIIYGDDLAARLGHATGFDVYGGGDNTGTINVMGGVATAGILMKQTPQSLRNGLGLAMNQASGTIDNIYAKSLAFKVPIALSAKNAIFSADLAAIGFDGPIDPIGGQFGFLNQWSETPDTALLTQGLGEEFYADAVIKPWPTCRASQAAVDATLQLVKEHNILPEQVEQVSVHVNPRTKAGFVGQDFTLDGNPEVAGAFSIQFAVATAVMCGDVGLEHMNETHMLDPAMCRMYDKTQLIDSLPNSEQRTAEVEIRLQNGEKHSQRVEHVLGDMHFAPLLDEQIENKFRKNIAWNQSLPDSTADKLLEVINELEHVDDIGEISRLLSPAL